MEHPEKEPTLSRLPYDIALSCYKGVAAGCHSMVIVMPSTHRENEVLA